MGNLAWLPLRSERGGRGESPSSHRGASALGGAAAVLLLAWGCSGGGGGDEGSGGGDDWDDPPTSDVDEGDIVAELELELPEEQDFILRATLPVPPDMVLDGFDRVPFAVVQPDGRSARTQVEIVSRYPDVARGADVVELLARVTRGRGLAGERTTYPVAFLPAEPAELQVDDAVAALLAEPGNLMLFTRDVFENEYVADIWRDALEATGEERVLRDGEIARQVSTHEILLPPAPIGGASGTMPHMMGVHSFLTTWSREEFVSLDLHVHNGFSGLAPGDPRDDALNRVYFEDLRLRVPRGWVVLCAFDNPFIGAPYDQGDWTFYPIVRALDTGDMHVMPRQAHFMRRLVVARAGAEERARATLEERGLAFCTPGLMEDGDKYFSWWNRSTARYFPQNTRMPSLEHVGLDAIRASLADDLAHFERNVRDGTPSPGGYPMINPALGWAHPWGVRYGGMTGGDEIHMYDGIDVAGSRSREGYRLAQLISRAYVDRQTTALYNVDGQPTRVVDWLEEGDGFAYVPFTFFLKPMLPEQDPFGFGAAPTFQDEAVASSGRVPDYEGELGAYDAIDLQHYIRYTRQLKVLAWLGNDALAKNELRMAAAAYRLGFHEHYNSPGRYIQGSGLLSAMTYVEHNPGWGLPMGRANGWGLDAALAVYAMGDDEVRRRYYPWFELVVETIANGQSTCTGIIQASPISKLAGGQFRLMQIFETGILENAFLGMLTTAFLGADDERAAQLEDILERSISASVSDLIWRPSHHGPANWTAVGPFDVFEPPYCGPPPAGGTDGGADGYYYWGSLAHAYRFRRDPLFLERLAEWLGGGDLLAEVYADGMVNLPNRAAVLALVQELYGRD